ncbi:MAG: S41 family peptidase [Paracoccaceae bacterium]|jgi:carboxyl-terminal processing protease|nr:S41 family peptidase [Paracoccaceae bacterium]|tara:strand:+ start:2718 stop:4040 length:1323 start_codon:yes stop_codon:yes gene_type:complete
MDKKVITAAVLGLITSAFITLEIAKPSNANEASENKSTYEQLSLFGDIFERIREKYVEEVNDEDLIRAAINGMLTSLDPHSSYLPPNDFDQMKVQTRGEFGGLGIEVTQEEGYVKVVSPIDDTPAFRAGIEAGDLITAVDGQSLLGLSLDEAVKLMRGPVGSEIVLTIFRETIEEPYDVTIIRDTIKPLVVRHRLEGDTAYVRLTTFNDQTYRGLEKAIKEMTKEAGGIKNINGFVLDLRNNPGGLLSQAIKVSDAFLDKGEIVSTRSKHKGEGDRFNAMRGDLAKGKPIVVIINGGSASASEIVAGALQDHRRAIILGTKSFGKGSVQTIMPLQGNGAIRLTTSRYYTPSGRSIQAVGVVPDILVEPRKASEDDENSKKTRSEASLRGSLTKELSETDKKRLDEEEEKLNEKAKLQREDYQLSYAIDLLRGFSVLQQKN